MAEKDKGGRPRKHQYTANDVPAAGQEQLVREGVALDRAVRRERYPRSDATTDPEKPEEYFAEVARAARKASPRLGVTDPRSFAEIESGAPLDQTTRIVDGNPVEPGDFAESILRLLAVASALLDPNRPLFDHEVWLLQKLKKTCEEADGGFNARAEAVAKQGGAAMALDALSDLHVEASKAWGNTLRVKDLEDREAVQRDLWRSIRDHVIDILATHLHGETPSTVGAKAALLVPAKFRGPVAELPLLSPAKAAEALFPKSSLVSEPARTLRHDWSPKKAFDAKLSDGTGLLPEAAGGSFMNSEQEVRETAAAIAGRLFQILAGDTENPAAPGFRVIDTREAANATSSTRDMTAQTSVPPLPTIPGATPLPAEVIETLENEWLEDLERRIMTIGEVD